MKLKKYLKETLITLFVISITTTGYAIVTTVTDEDTLTATIWNEMKDIVNSNEAKLSNISIVGDNIGIGTTEPDSKLEINNSSNDICNLKIRNGGGSAKGILISGGNSGNDASLLKVERFDGTQTFFEVKDGNSYFNNGNVGIGTDNPTSKLEVHSSLNNGAVIRIQSTAVDGYPRIATKNDEQEWDIYSPDGSQDNAFVLYDRTGGGGTKLKINTTANGGDFEFRNGNVGIGVVPATEKLDVAGTVKAESFDIGYEIVTNSLYKDPWTTSTYVDAVCPAGKKIIGGGCNASRANYDNSNMHGDYPVNDTTWRCKNDAESTLDLTLTTYAICANVQ